MITRFKKSSIFLWLLAAFLFSSYFVNALENDFISPEIFSQKGFDVDAIQEFRYQAKKYSDSANANQAIIFAKKYINNTKDLSIINDHFFIEIEKSDQYFNFKSRYKPQINLLSVFYIFAGFLGLLIFIILNLKKTIRKKSTFLMSLFVLFHSLFILHLSLYLINCQYYFPHTLLFSTAFTLLYGPLIYLYFKMTDIDYKLKWIDSLHFLPALILLIYIFPFYRLSSIEKFSILFNQEEILANETNIIFLAKFISLVIYAIFTFKIYQKSKLKSEEKIRKLLWQRNIIAIYIIYIIAFVFYIAITSGFFDSPIFFHLQILVMVCIVFYVAYITYSQPEILRGELKIIDPINLFKYEKSGLTKNFSLDLKNQLIALLEEEKIYMINDINLNMLSQKLGTSRHNTSQVINEHFDLNFFELINEYRIKDAVELLKKDNNLNIIEVAYKVGFNNKTTFNKYFKQELNQTPTQFVKSLKGKDVS
jgi:AraC-like DNA-binding protein